MKFRNSDSFLQVYATCKIILDFKTLKKDINNFSALFLFSKSKNTSLHRFNFSFPYFSFQSEQITKSGPPQRPRFPLSPRGGPRPLRPPFGFGPRPRGPPPHLMRPPSVRLNLPTQSQSVSPSTAVVASSGDPLTKPLPPPNPSLSTLNHVTLNKASNPATQSSLVHNRPEETMDASFNVSGSEPIKQLMVIRLDI